MEAWRQWLLGGEKNLVQRRTKRIYLTPTGLLMEGDFTQTPRASDLSVLGIYRLGRAEATGFLTHHAGDRLAWAAKD
jgi:hypothetical protein